MSSNYKFDWSDLAFGSKKTVNELKAIFIAAPREISAARFTQLIKEHLPKSNIILGLAQEDYIVGFEGQPQFRTLKAKTIQKVIDKVNVSASQNKIYTLTYFQRDLNYIFQKLDFKKTLLVNGSWQHVFHNLPAYYTLVNRHISYKLISPFIDESEARQYEKDIIAQIPNLRGTSFQGLQETYSGEEMLYLALKAAKLSFDYTFQTGGVLGKRTADKYSYLAHSFNKVVPFQTYAMHYGSSREAHFSPPHDLNYYDAVHTEVELIIKAQKEQINLKGATLFINLLPCPACSRMLSETDIAEFVYKLDHSAGYGINLLEKSGKIVRRVTSEQGIIN